MQTNNCPFASDAAPSDKALSATTKNRKQNGAVLKCGREGVTAPATVTRLWRVIN